MASWRHCLTAGCLLLVCVGAQAGVRARAQTLTLPGVTLADVKVLAFTQGDGRPHLTLDAAKVSVPALGWHDVGLVLQGQPQAAYGSAWKFVGRVQARNAPGAALADAGVVMVYDPEGGTLEIDVAPKNGSVQALLPLDQPTHIQLTLTDLPLRWLRGVLAQAWTAGRMNGGTATGDVAVDLSGDGVRVSGRVQLDNVKLDTRAGDVATQELTANGAFRIKHGPDATAVMFDGTLHGGQMLFGPVYAQLPGHAANVHVAATFDGAGVTVSSLDFDDHDALRLTGSLAFDRKGGLKKLDITRFAANLPAAQTRYGTALFTSLTGLDDVDASGSLAGSLKIGTRGLEAFDITTHDVSFDSRDGALAVRGLDGRVRWRTGASDPATTLGWGALDLYRIPFGAATLVLENDDGALTLRKPVSIDVLGGKFDLERFAWRPDPGKSQRLDAAFAVTGVAMPALSKAFGWPAFEGTLGGAVPDLSYREGELVFGGGLSLSVFDGAVSVTRLAMRHPFGVAPELAADITLHQLDLSELTGVFDFGQITGRLDGHVANLHMVDWKPTAFTAQLRAPDGGRISQHAINSLAKVGGGGIGGGIQGMALRLFQTFHYAQLGLTCVLADGVCTMGGITPDPVPDRAGYTIVEGSGLPRITVIGHERKVDWATLVARLKSATEGSGPVIE